MKPKLKLFNNGRFHVENADAINGLYFPLTNTYGLKSAISPNLNGDAKINQNSFLLLPNSIEDLTNSPMNRNLYFRVNDTYTWSITGQTPYQLLNKDKVSVEGDFLIHKVTRENQDIHCDIESFVPMNESYAEWHRVIFKNISSKSMKVKTVLNIPLFSRSADNLRDHRHVTSLLNKMTIYSQGIINQPTFSFDERGHKVNDISYAVLYHADNLKLKRYWPILEEFIGDGHSLLNPSVVEQSKDNDYQVGDVLSGYEATGGFEFETFKLQADESITLIFIIAADQDRQKLLNTDISVQSYELLKQQTIDAWRNELDSLTFTMKDPVYNGWLKWVTLQPTLRRIYGCSFLPHHDYGRGGRGWRDLWQDLLALILMNPTSVKPLLFNNFQGIRIDGSNATIIGEKPGEFLADRNHIARVWMDHGAWPLLTTMLYVHKTGDYQILLQEQSYFQDQFSHYTKKVNAQFFSLDYRVKNRDGSVYKGTILEHLLIENLVPFYNVGAHHNIRIEDADWNDALDMAHQKGESVAFTSLYGHNLIELSKVLEHLHKLGIEKIELLNSIDDLIQPLDDLSVEYLTGIRDRYFNRVAVDFDGQKKTYNVLHIAKALEEKGVHLLEQVRHNEWLSDGHKGWFNGYYDGDGFALESIDKNQMTLTGQVFAIYSGAATNDQTSQIIDSAKKLLYNEKLGGYRLNTNYHEIKLNMGRMFGFAYGHKENGAMFSHMAVMFANALYRRGFIKEGYQILKEIYEHCIDIETAKIYPGIPEYIDPKGRGMYHYLTGSASWYILTMVSEVFGVKALFGQLVLEPKLMNEQFDDHHEAKIKTVVNGKVIEIVYLNKENLNYGDYRIKEVLDDKGIPMLIDQDDQKVLIGSVSDTKTLTVILSR